MEIESEDLEKCYKKDLESELKIITLIRDVLKPLTSGSEELSRDNITIIEAEASFEYVVDSLDSINHPLAEKMCDSVLERYHQRRSIKDYFEKQY